MNMNHISDQTAKSPAIPHPTPSESSKSLLHDITHNVNFGQDIDFVVGVTATALASDQLLKAKDSKEHKKMHLAKAGLSAAAAAAAFTMMRREHLEEHHRRGRRRSTDRTRARHRSLGSDTDSDPDDERARAKSHSPNYSLSGRDIEKDHGRLTNPTTYSMPRQRTGPSDHARARLPSPGNEDAEDDYYHRPNTLSGRTSPDAHMQHR